MTKNKLFIFSFFFWLTCVDAQTRESDRLLQQSFQTVYSNPDEAVKIARHVIKSAQNPEQKAKAYLLSAEAHYIKGMYDQSLADAFEARNLSAEKKDNRTYSESTFIIADILKFLQLNRESEKYLSEIPIQKEHFPLKNSWEIKSLITRAGTSFQKQQNDSAVVFLEEALFLAKKIDNPFLQLKIHEKLSANFLSLDEKAKYHRHNQEALALHGLTTRIENHSFNTAHQLITREKDKELANVEKQFANLLWGFLTTAGLCLLILVILKTRNRNKLKTYSTLLKYLNKEKKKSSESPKESTAEVQRTKTILKESEDQILMGLQKFESSKRFISNDMSLGMLAAQLNTNTKYLSEVINRHKEKTSTLTSMS